MMGGAIPKRRERRIASTATLSIVLLVIGSAVAIAQTLATRGPLQLCAAIPSLCISGKPASAPVSMTDEILSINRDVNERLRYAGEMPGQDVWRIVAPGGLADCEDFAETKRFRLLWAGVPSGAMKIAKVRSWRATQLHAVLLVLIGSAWFALDNRTDIVWPAEDLRDEYVSTEVDGQPMLWKSGGPE